MMEILRLGPADLARARVLVQRFFEAVAPPVDLRSWLWDRRNLMVGAFEEGVPAGMAFGYHLPRPDGGGDMLLLYSIDVAEPFRRRGLGRSLVAAFREQASERGMWLVTNESNEAAMALYRAAGGERPHDDDAMFVFRGPPGS